MKRFVIGMILTGLVTVVNATTECGPACQARQEAAVSGLVGVSQTPPQAGAGVAVGIVCPLGIFGVVEHDPDFQVRCTEVIAGTLSGNDVEGSQDGLQAMAPEEDSVVRAVNVESSQPSVEAISGRTTLARSGGASTAIALSVDGEPVDSLPGYDGEVGLSAGDLDFGEWGFFLDGFFATGDKSATTLESGFDFDSWGFTMGIDRQIGAKGLLGAALAYNALDADLDSDEGGADFTGFGFFAYGSYYPNDNLYMDAILGYNRGDIDQNRNIRYQIASVTPGAPPVTSVNQTAVSTTDSDEFSASLALGYDFYRKDYTVGPYARLQYANVQIDGYTESIDGTGAGSGLAVSMDSQEFDSLPLTLGIQASRQWDTSWATLNPLIFAEYVREFLNDGDEISGSFVGDATGTSFFLPTDRPDRNVFNVGINVAAEFDNGNFGFLGFKSMLGHKDISLYVLEAGFRVPF